MGEKVTEIGLISGKTFLCKGSKVRTRYQNFEPDYVEIIDPDKITRISWNAIAYIIYENQRKEERVAHACSRT